MAVTQLTGRQNKNFEKILDLIQQESQRKDSDKRVGHIAHILLDMSRGPADYYQLSDREKQLLKIARVQLLKKSSDSKSEKIAIALDIMKNLNQLRQQGKQFGS